MPRWQSARYKMTTYTWRIYLDDNFLGYVYAPTSKEACQQALKNGGIASQMNAQSNDLSYERIN